MKKHQILIIFFLFLNFTLSASEDWGKNGHRTVGEIAQNHLSKQAGKRIKELLKGQSLAFVSTYADEIRSDSKYKKYDPWHYVNFPFESNYEAHPKSQKGDIIFGINKAIEVLKSQKSTNEEKVFHLKMLVHFMGDLHQPLHIGFEEDKGGNDFQVNWFNKTTNLHSVWDTSMIEDYQMSYTELVANSDRLSPQQLAEIQSGSVTDWMYESRELCKDIYSNTEIGQKLSYGYSYKYLNVVRSQLQKGGIRLAVLLNDIFE